jgi:hypothetical protein
MLLRKAQNNSLPLVLACSVLAFAPRLAGAAKIELVVVGPVEKLDCVSNTLQILGIRLRASKPIVLRQLCESHDGVPFRYVAVAGYQDGEGNAVAANVVRAAASGYVPGASPVFVRGGVSSVSPLIGEFEIGGSRITGYNGPLPELRAPVEVVGTQPLPGGSVIAATVSTAVRLKSTIAEASADANGIVGSGVSASGIVGSGLSTKGIV